MSWPTFLHPGLAAAGLACVAIPILIHLLMRRRRRPVPWAAMRFLLEAFRRQRRRLRLEQWLLLACRCMVIAALAAAIGGPLVASAGALGAGGPVTVYVLLDNSVAAGARSADGSVALDRHKVAVRRLLDTLDAGRGDRAGLIALGGPADAMVVPASSNPAAVASLLADLPATDSAADVAGAAAAVRDALASGAEQGRRVAVVVVSDFLAGSADVATVLPTLAPSDADVIGTVSVLATLPAAVGVSNVAIRSADPGRAVLLAADAGGTEPVRVTLRRSGPGVGQPESTRLRVRLVGAGGAAAAVEQTVRWQRGQTEAAITLGLGGMPAPGPALVVAEIDADDLAADDLWHAPVEIRSSLRVGLVASARLVAGASGLDPAASADWLRLALAPSSGTAEAGTVELVAIDASTVDGPRLAGLDAVFIAAPDRLSPDAWARLRAAADAGALVAVIPTPTLGAQTWTDELTERFGLPWSIGREPVAAAEALTLAADLPAAGRSILSLIAAEFESLARPVRVIRRLEVESPAADLVLVLNDGSPFLLAAAPGSTSADAAEADRDDRPGLVVLFSAALAMDWTDLASKPLIVPLLHELVRQGVGRARGRSAELAGTTPRTPPRSVELRPATDLAAGSAGTFAVNDDGAAAGPIRHAGVWRPIDARGAPRGLLAINADSAGSLGDARSESEIEAWLAPMAGGRFSWMPTEPAAGSPPAATSAPGDDGDPSRLALPLLVGALALAGLEALLARWFSHAAARPGGAA